MLMKQTVEDFIKEGKEIKKLPPDPNIEKEKEKDKKVYINFYKHQYLNGRELKREPKS